MDWWSPPEAVSVPATPHGWLWISTKAPFGTFTRCALPSTSVSVPCGPSRGKNSQAYSCPVPDFMSS